MSDRNPGNTSFGPSRYIEVDREKYEDILAQLTAARDETALLENSHKIISASVKEMTAELFAARSEIHRLLTLTSEQATEIVGKDKEIAALQKSFVDLYDRLSGIWDDAERKDDGRAYFGSLNDADSFEEAVRALDVMTWDYPARAVLSELQLKGK